ncbi:MAG TPA: thiosulfohydrolase SoxB [Acidiferrobacter sp.]|nr:thiosulfohydrolase SoxB [Acidiferrobacter sp.]
MSLSRREFLQMLAVAGASGAGLTDHQVNRMFSSHDTAATASHLYDMPVYGNVSLLHMTDCHAQLLPVYFREPNINIGVGQAWGRPPHLVGEHYLKHFHVPFASRRANAFTYLDFTEASRRFGKIGGFAHLATLLKTVRGERAGRSLFLDGGDTWQGSATSLWTEGRDMIGAQKLLGVDAMTAHWEFTYGAKRVKQAIDTELKGHIEFLAQNVNDSTWGSLVFSPYMMREVNGVLVAVIGQAFPYTPIANPAYMVPDWEFGIDQTHMQKTVNEVRAKGAQVVAVLSHNGMDVDLKMAHEVHGIDVILGGHTHDAEAEPVNVRNNSGTTLVFNSGSNTKFLLVLDLDVRGGRVRGYRSRLMPIFADLLPADPEVAHYIDRVRAPYKAKLAEPLAVSEGMLFRRGNFNGTFDQLIIDAQLAVSGAQLALSPGFRWGTSLLPGESITMEDVMNQTAITYPATTISTYTGKQLKGMLEQIADNLFNKDPYYQQGGDMVRVGGFTYTMAPSRDIGHRISDLRLLNGKPIEANKGYTVSGWANVYRSEHPGTPIWDVVSEYLRDKKTIHVEEPYTPRLLGVQNNPGYAPWSAPKKTMTGT